MNLAAAVGAFLVIFPLELPDKSLIASLVLSTRFRPWPVWIGVAAAFTVHVAIAVLFGGLISLLPERLVEVIVAVAFAAGAAVLLLGSEEEEEDAGERLARSADMATHHIIASSFAVIFVAEWGDLTQIMTANLAAHSGAPLSVGIGALLALWTVAAIGIVAGRVLLRAIPLGLVRRLTGVVLAALAVWTVVELIRG
jgi:putative Ca2+/H+ antiporter (TMEM165/GDT1 family)